MTFGTDFTLWTLKKMLDLIVILLFTLGPASILFLGYRKFKRSMIQQTTEAVVNKLPDPDDEVVMLHGHNLAKWNYLGYTRCTYVDEAGKITSEYPIFLFASKKDMNRRSFYVASEYAEKNHPYMNKTVKPWAAGEGDVYHIIAGEGNKPSDFLKQYMLDTFGAEWNTDTNWWGTNDKAKYTAAKNKQKREQKTKEAEPKTNVVTVDFGKQA